MQIPVYLRKAALPLLAFVLLAHSFLAYADDRRVEKRIAPVYPELAKRMRIAGVVKVEATVAPDGNVSATKATAGNKMLTASAEEAVKRWKFVPASSESTVEIEVNFELN